MPEPLLLDVIHKAMNGDRLAFRTIVEKHQHFAYAVSFRFLRNEQDAEDIVQEAFVRLWKNIHNYQKEIKLSTWLYRIIANLCLDFLKSAHGKQRRNKVDLSDGYFMQDPSTPEKEMQNRELMKAILDASEELTPKQRMVFILRDMEALPVEEVCLVLSMSAGSVKSNLYYARQKIHEKLKIFYQASDKQFTL